MLEMKNKTSALILRFSALWFFTTEFVIVICLLKLFSDKWAFMHLKISTEIKEQQDMYHVLTLLWCPYGGFPISLF